MVFAVHLLKVTDKFGFLFPDNQTKEKQMTLLLLPVRRKYTGFCRRTKAFLNYDYYLTYFSPHISEDPSTYFRKFRLKENKKQMLLSLSQSSFLIFCFKFNFFLVQVYLQNQAHEF